MNKGRGRPKLAPDEADRFHALLREALKKFPNQNKLGEALELGDSAISQLLSRKNGPSIRTAELLKEIMGVDFMRKPNGLKPVALPAIPSPTPEPLRSRSQWQHLADPALEILIREGHSADESRRAIDAAVVFRSDREITLEDIVRFARSTIRESRRDSGKHRKHKSSK